MTFTLAGWLYAVLRRLPSGWAKDAAWNLWWRFHSPSDLGIADRWGEEPHD